MTNGKSALTILGITVTIILAFTSYVVGNDTGSRARDEKLSDRLVTVELAVTRIDTSLTALSNNYKEQRVETKESLGEIKTLIKEMSKT